MNSNITTSADIERRERHVTFSLMAASSLNVLAGRVIALDNWTKRTEAKD